jgi:hypothetical protein
MRARRDVIETKLCSHLQQEIIIMCLQDSSPVRLGGDGLHQRHLWKQLPRNRVQLMLNRHHLVQIQDRGKEYSLIL